MSGSQLSRSRFWVGIALVALAVAILVGTKGNASIAGAIAIGILGLVSIAISRKNY